MFQTFWSKNIIFCIIIIIVGHNTEINMITITLWVILKVRVLKKLIKGCNKNIIILSFKVLELNKMYSYWINEHSWIQHWMGSIGNAAVVKSNKENI